MADSDKDIPIEAAPIAVDPTALLAVDPDAGSPAGNGDGSEEESEGNDDPSDSNPNSAGSQSVPSRTFSIPSSADELT